MSTRAPDTWPPPRIVEPGELEATVTITVRRLRGRLHYFVAMDPAPSASLPPDVQEVHVVIVHALMELGVAQRR